MARSCRVSGGLNEHGKRKHAETEQMKDEVRGVPVFPLIAPSRPLHRRRIDRHARHRDIRGLDKREINRKTDRQRRRAGESQPKRRALFARNESEHPCGKDRAQFYEWADVRRAEHYVKCAMKAQV